MQSNIILSIISLCIIIKLLFYIGNLSLSQTTWAVSTFWECFTDEVKYLWKKLAHEENVNQALQGRKKWQDFGFSENISCNWWKNMKKCPITWHRFSGRISTTTKRHSGLKQTPVPLTLIKVLMNESLTLFRMLMLCMCEIKTIKKIVFDNTISFMFV